MANDLVRWNNDPLRPDDRHAAASAGDEEWDLPPELDPQLQKFARPHADGQKPTPRQQRINRNRNAEKDVADAQKRGDFGFAALRETDAAEHAQARWDWGDARTWAWIAAMFFGFLLLVASVYYMPYGRHNQNDGGNSGKTPTPTIRVY